MEITTEIYLLIVSFIGFILGGTCFLATRRKPVPTTDYEIGAIGYILCFFGVLPLFLWTLTLYNINYPDVIIYSYFVLVLIKLSIILTVVFLGSFYFIYFSVKDIIVHYKARKTDKIDGTITTFEEEIIENTNKTSTEEVIEDIDA